MGQPTGDHLALMRKTEKCHLLREPHDTATVTTKRAPSGTDSVVSGLSSCAASCSASTLLIGGGPVISRSSSALGSSLVSGGGGVNRPRSWVHVGVIANTLDHQRSHRRSVRTGTPLCLLTSLKTLANSAAELASSTTTSRYTRRPRNRSDGGVARLRQPRRPQQSENRRENPSPADAISAPRGLRS